MRLITVVLFTSLCFLRCNVISPKSNGNEIFKIEMHLNGYGVESNTFPAAINAYIDLRRDSGYSEETFYNPEMKPKRCLFSSDEISKIKEALHGENLKALKNNYTTNQSDMPRSTAVFYRNTDTIKIDDYGLVGDNPLQTLYKTVYKL